MSRRHRPEQAPQRLGEIVADSGAPPLDVAERMVWERIPTDIPGGARGAIPYEQAVDVPGLTANQSRHALFRLVGARRARAWQAAPGLLLVARGPFRQCDRCGTQCAPGVCLWCGHDPAAPQERAA